MIHVLSLENAVFPPVSLADRRGLLAVGGDLSVKRLLAAYKLGIFPWYDEAPILWWFLSPRMVLFPENLIVHKSMRSLFTKKAFRVSFDTCFGRVMEACGQTPRKDQDGTWISSEMLVAYSRLYELGYAHSVEVWEGDLLVGGLYGVALGRVFYGESMFSHRSNASKYGFISLVQCLQKAGFALIDCQQETPHLGSLGASPIPGKQFSQLLLEHTEAPSLMGNWGELLLS